MASLEKRNFKEQHATDMLIMSYKWLKCELLLKQHTSDSVHVIGGAQIKVLISFDACEDTMYLSNMSISPLFFLHFALEQLRATAQRHSKVTMLLTHQLSSTQLEEPSEIWVFSPSAT